MNTVQPSAMHAPGALAVRCSRCAAEMTSPVLCPACRTLFAPPAGIDHFRLLGLARAFSLDEVQLQSAYRALARAVHPDRFAGQSDETAALATTISASLNDALNVLCDPLRRADYLLFLAGGPSAMDERGVPGTLLAEIMTLREEIGAAREGDDRSALDRIRANLNDRRRDAMTVVTQLAGHLDQANEAQRHELRRQLNSLKYYDNLLAQAIENASAQPL